MSLLQPSFLELFFGIVRQYRSKDAILVDGTTAYSYGQLLSKAIRIAGDIQSFGIKSGEPVGIGISKSADYIASMLGVWLAGGAFVPLDPALPKERAQFIINQSSMRAVLAKPQATTALAALGVKPINVDDNWNDDGNYDAVKVKSIVTPPEQLAYIIYTSGSTGRPKGVMVTHSGIVNLLEEQIDAFKLDENSRCLFILSTNFDASVSDIGTSLLAGSTLCIEPQGLLQPGPNFLNLLNDRKITHMDIPPSLLKTIPSEDAPETLQTIIIGGEACAPDTVRRWAQKCLVVNVYGPTEATVCTSLGACDADTWERPLIGQPLANNEYLILDEACKPVRPGTAGELYIGGIGLAKGYVDEPELTARKFVSINGKRWYRTGDLVMQCEDGEYQFLGRVDRQFKLRGMLIEPEEIESRLRTHPDIAMAAVLKRELRPGFPGEKLVAFILPREEKPADPSADNETNYVKKTGDLRTHLLKHLPPWMVPQIFEFVDSMPMTLTGKIDLSLLKIQPLRALPDTEPYTATSETQKLLLEVWKQVLGVESVGIHDDFYALGGDSLNIIEAVLAAHVRGLTISPDLFALHSTVSELAEVLDRKNSSSSSAAADAAEESPGGLTSDFLRDDVKLDERFIETVSRRASAKRCDETRTLKSVFMTGATGFLGSGLLYELLQQTDARFYCLVRANSLVAAISRLRSALRTHGKAFSAVDESRIQPVLGDLTKPFFGISSDSWKKLTNEIDTVFHSAATVNMVKDYYELKAANVDGTREIARFVVEGKPKQLHYASTLSVFVATTRNTGVASESDKLNSSFSVYSGYAQTKVAAELMLRELEERGFPISFYRFGLLTGDSHSGLSAKDDFLNLFARGLSSLGRVPESADNIQVDITPVDYAVKAMAHIAISDTAKGASNTYHIANEHGLPLSALVKALNNLGFNVQTLPAKDFLSALKYHSEKLTSAESAACLALCRTLADKNSFSEFRTMDLFQATDIRFDCSNAKSVLAPTSIQCPPPTVALIELYLGQALGLAQYQKN